MDSRKPHFWSLSISKDETEVICDVNALYGFTFGKRDHKGKWTFDSGQIDKCKFSQDYSIDIASWLVEKIEELDKNGDLRRGIRRLPEQARRFYKSGIAS